MTMMRTILAAGAMTAAMTISSAATAGPTINGALGAAGMTNYQFGFAGGAFSVAVNSAGASALFDPMIYVFADDGSPLTAKTGATIGSNDDTPGSLNSFLSVTGLAAGNYVLTVSSCCYSETAFRTSIGNSAAAGATYQVLFSDGVTLASAVPEPAAWGMMILGLGLVGGVLRRKVRQSEVRFDAPIRGIEASAA